MSSEPAPFCPDCGHHACPYPTPEAHRIKSRPKRSFLARLLRRR